MKHQIFELFYQCTGQAVGQAWTPLTEVLILLPSSELVKTGGVL